VPHDYSKVLPKLLALFVSYVNVIVFDDFGRLIQISHCALSNDFENFISSSVC